MRFENNSKPAVSVLILRVHTTPEPFSCVTLKSIIVMYDNKQLHGTESLLRS